MASPFNFHATQSDSDEMQDEVPSDSDYEHLNSNGGTRAAQVLHSWYGRQILRHHCASEIAKNASTSTTAAQLDVSQSHLRSVKWSTKSQSQWSLSQAEANFPYAEILGKLQQSGLLDVEVSRSFPEDGGFLKAVAGLGSAALDEIDRPGWASNVLSGSMSTIHVPRSDLNGRTHIRDARSAPGLTAMVDRSLSDDSDLPKYTMKMNEVVGPGDCRAFYTDKTISLVPPNFEVTLRFGDSTYKGRASTKKKARHVASKNACLDQGFLP